MFRLTAFAALLLFALGTVVLTASAQAPADTAKAAPADTAKAAPADTAKAAPADTAKAHSSEPAQPKPPAVLYEKAKIVVDGEAEANGSISILFTPEGGKTTTLSIDVVKETNKDDIAKAIHTKIALAAGEQFKVKASGQEIKIEQAKEKKGPKFAVSVEKIAVPGVSVLVKKD